MKTLQIMAACAAISSLSCSWVGFAADEIVPVPVDPPVVDPVVRPPSLEPVEKPVVVPKPSEAWSGQIRAWLNSLRNDWKNRPVPPIPDSLPDELKQKISEARDKANTFWTEQAAVREQLKSATEEQRAKLRQELAQSRQEFMEQQKALMQQIRDQIRELRTKVNEERNRMLEEAKEKAKQERSRAKGGE